MYMYLGMNSTYFLVCSSSYFTTEGSQSKCVWISPSLLTKSWDDAKTFCEDMDMHLLTFNSKQSSKAFGEFLKQPGQPTCEYLLKGIELIFAILVVESDHRSASILGAQQTV